MYPKTHILLGGIFAILIYFILQLTIFQAIVIFLASVLIDIDHYLYYVYRKKDFSLKNAYNWFLEGEKKFDKLPENEKKKIFIGIYIFHGIEAIIILILLSYLSKFFLFVLIGFLFHQSFDLIDILIEKASPSKVISLIHSLIIKKNKKNIEYYIIKKDGRKRKN